jgi:hypothetical protein
LNIELLGGSFCLGLLEWMKMESKKPMDIDVVITRVRYFAENLDDWL